MTAVQQAILEHAASLVEADSAVMESYAKLAATMVEAFGERGNWSALALEANVNALVSDVVRAAFWLGVQTGRDPWTVLGE